MHAPNVERNYRNSHSSVPTAESTWESNMKTKLESIQTTLIHTLNRLDEADHELQIDYNTSILGTTIKKIEEALEELDDSIKSISI